MTAALTVWNPYALLLVLGEKTVENRDWAPGLPLGARILVHAGAKHDIPSWEHALGVLASSPRHVNTLAGAPWPVDGAVPNPDADPEGATPYGAIVGEVTLEAVVRAPRPRDRWWVGPVGWYVRRPVAIAPVFCRGMPGIFKPPADVVAQASARITAKVAAMRAELDRTYATSKLVCPACGARPIASEELTPTCPRDPRHLLR